MNIYDKLNEARLQFAAAGKKMTGSNGHTKRGYYTLNDILPTLNKICAGLHLCNIVSFGQEMASLTIINTEGQERGAFETIAFTSPMSTASLKGCHEVQNLGAVETYLRRYLYLAAYEIVEDDLLDDTFDPTVQPATQVPQVKSPVRMANDRQRDDLLDLADKFTGDERDYLLKAAKHEGLTAEKAEYIIYKSGAKLDGRTQ